MAQALVRYLAAQWTEIDGKEVPLCGGGFAIFGHGNVSCLSEPLHEVADLMPTWRGQNEQSMALAAVAYAKAMKRRRFMFATSSIGPGATNMVTAAGVAHANRLPVLLMSGDTFTHRMPDPVLQQVENFHSPSVTANDAFRPVVRYWDRIVKPSQLMATLPQALSVLLDPAECGPVFLALPQDVQAEAYDYPEKFFERQLRAPRRPHPDPAEIRAAAAAIRTAQRPVIIAGGGVHYAQAEQTLAAFAERHRVPVLETVGGRSSLPHGHPSLVGPIGVLGSDEANTIAAQADLVVAVGTRLQDFTTASWSLFQDDGLRIVGINAARFDAVKHTAIAVVADARVALDVLDAALPGWQAPEDWAALARKRHQDWNAAVEARTRVGNAAPVTYAQAVGAVNRAAKQGDVVLTAAGGLPGEIDMNWRATGIADVDVEYGYSCMGYEVAGGWGAKIAHPDREVFVMVGDGSYLIMNSDILSSVMTGHKLIVVLCDNGGFAVIDRLQRNTGNESFNNLLSDCRRVRDVQVDFAAHARAMGAIAEQVQSIADLEEALVRARAADRTTLISIAVDKYGWSPNSAWWEVGVPEASRRPKVLEAAAQWQNGRAKQRRGV
ncbi:MAG TPA: 3D-(3,5/4)-trihydroxycyclohexane-1,2-dione acylhydrolase (decyclizing) [Acetobacteraceae bacterium]|nr:3D-(3,5/4)-trihydroxycyclohexane-1,2-dione acylhydrolase (decyclizing) [Acetobacteraceae bacterium]